MIPYNPSPGSIAWGVFLTPPEIVGVPDGATLARVRFRPSEFATAFIRRAGRFEQWSLVREKPGVLRLHMPMAQNVRP